SERSISNHMSQTLNIVNSFRVGCGLVLQPSLGINMIPKENYAQPHRNVEKTGMVASFFWILFVIIAILSAIIFVCPRDTEPI
ncbi:2864_t:CDS:2, partial [Funneliformis geosporum]